MVDRISMHRSILVLFIALGILTGPTQSAHAGDSAPMTRAARLTYMQGSVSVAEPNYPAGVPAQLNLPLLSGIQLLTGSDGRAEVEFEDGSVVRLTPNSALSLDSLTVQPDGVFMSDLSVLRGLVYCELRATPQYRYTLNAGGDVLSPVENTTVRVSFDEPPATFSVLDGTAQVERQSAPNGEASAGYQTQVHTGETFRADPTDASRYFLTQQIAEDSWDQWNDDRDQAAASEAADSTAVRNDYAGAQGYGWSDLDANGSWYDVPGEGQVWQPQVAVDDSSFDPYGNGAWVWYPNTGYLWASSYAWGWTPYRCGNWSYFNGFGWGWAPGAGCGGFGWGFAGGGQPVNIGFGPTGYRPIRIPVAGGPPRKIPPILTVQPINRPEPAEGFQPGPRRIAGVVVAPIKPVGEGPIGGGGTAHSSLQRDFPIDSATRAPVLGLASTNPTVVRTTSGLRSTQARPGNPEAPQGQSPQVPYSGYGGQPYRAGGQSHSAGATSAPPPAPVERPAHSSRPTYSPSTAKAPAPPSRPAESAPRVQSSGAERSSPK